MSLEQLTHQELNEILNQLDQAIYNHQQWYKALIRVFVCKLQENENDVADDAHKRCFFGQWYYNHAPWQLLNHQGFNSIGDAHQVMHKLTKHLLDKAKTGESIKPLEFDNFSNALERLRLEIDNLKNEIENLLYIHDPLTMAISRIHMLTMLREQQAFVIRANTPCCFVMFDIDDFKKVNDTYGHIAGDKVLSQCAQHIIQHLRPYDKLFRYGGEEFLLCLPQTSPYEAFEIVERLRTQISELDFDIGKMPPIHITISIGLALLDPKMSVEQSIDCADKAMYAAKRNGKNNTIIFSAALHEKEPVI